MESMVCKVQVQNFKAILSHENLGSHIPFFSSYLGFVMLPSFTQLITYELYLPAKHASEYDFFFSTIIKRVYNFIGI